MAGLLSSPMTQGLLNRPQSAGWMTAGGGTGPGGGMDPRDAPGSGLSIWRELMRGLSSQGIAALSPDMAGKIFSPENRALLAPAYQKGTNGGRSAR